MLWVCLDREVDGPGLIEVDLDSAPIPFESQFFHDDPDDAFVDDAIGPATLGDGDAEDLWQGTQGQELKRSRPENVNFAKKAKRVDVKRLKDDIWSGLRTLIPEDTKSDLESVRRSIISCIKLKQVYLRGLIDSRYRARSETSQDIRHDHSRSPNDLSPREDV